jgi:hypothetical protein
MANATTTMLRTTTTSVPCAFPSENDHPLFNFPRMYRAYLDCRRSKRNKPDALAFERDYEANLITLVEELRERRYQPSTSTLFYTDKPKLREIFAAAFRDRIVHHLIKLWQEFYFLRRFFKRGKHKLTRLDQPLRRKSDLKQQVRWLQRNFDGHICLIQIGCYYEAFGPQAEKLAGALGLSLRQNWRGFASACGFPQQHLPKMAAKLEKLRMPVVIARQTGRELYSTKERLPDLILEYPTV